MILNSQIVTEVGQILNVNVEVNYEPSPPDLEELRYSLLYLRVLEQLKEVRDHLDLRLPYVGVYLDQDNLLGRVPISTRGAVTVTMNDTDLLLEAATEYLLKGREPTK